jgi:hypothetical protein
MTASLLASLLVVSPVIAQDAPDKERERTYRLMTEGERKAANSIEGKLADPAKAEKFTNGESIVLRKYWYGYFDTETGKDRLLKWAEERASFAEFCDNVAITKKDRRRELAADYMLLPPGETRTCLALSRRIKEHGLASIGGHLRQFIQEHRPLFEAVLESK